jgi:RNA polymerase sigma-70 factor (ECF subfamily)
VAKKVEGVPRAVVLNGQPATVFLAGDDVVSAMVLDILDGVIIAVRVVSNPDKLARLTAQLGSPGPRSVRL